MIYKEQAIGWIHQALHFDTTVEREIVAIVPSIPLSLTGMPYCEACESVLCGVCGRCHEDTKQFVFIEPRCPVAVPNMERPGCLAWSYAYQFLSQARRASDLADRKRKEESE